MRNKDKLSIKQRQEEQQPAVSAHIFNVEAKITKNSLIIKDNIWDKKKKQLKTYYVTKYKQTFFF